MHPLFLNGNAPSTAGIKLRNVLNALSSSPRYENVRNVLLRPPVLWCNIKYVDLNFSHRLELYVLL